MRTKKDSIERFKEKKVQEISRQSKYLEELLTASLPRYYTEDNEQMVSNSLIEAKRSYANEVTVKWAQNDDRQIIRLRKTFSKHPLSIRISPKKEDIKFKSPQKSSQRSPQKSKNEQNELSKHPYSIMKQLENEQKNKPQSEKFVYRYRGLNQLRVYNIQEVSSFIDELTKKSSDSQSGKLSVTDQFLLMNYIDLKIEKLIQAAKIEQKRQRKNPPPVYNYGCAKQEKDKNRELVKLFQQINPLWSLYQLKLNHCSDMLRNNGPNDEIILEMKKLYQEILKLSEQIKKHEDTCVHKKINKFNPDPCYQSIVKKIKTVIKRFKQIITIKRQ